MNVCMYVCMYVCMCGDRPFSCKSSAIYSFLPAKGYVHRAAEKVARRHFRQGMEGLLQHLQTQRIIYYNDSFYTYNHSFIHTYKKEVFQLTLRSIVLFVYVCM